MCSVSEMSRTFAEIVTSTRPTQDDQVLLAFSLVNRVPATLHDVESLFAKYKVKIPSNLYQNISRLVRRGDLDPIEGEGPPAYKIADAGRTRIVEITEQDSIKNHLTPATKTLRQSLGGITDSLERDYVAEALDCHEIGASRAAVVMSWIAVVQHLRLLIERKGIQVYERAYRARYHTSKTRIATKRDDLAYFDDSKLIQVCEDIGLLDRNERIVLTNECLGLRNKCAHPSKFRPGPLKVNAFFEDVASIVLSKK